MKGTLVSADEIFQRLKSRRELQVSGKQSKKRMYRPVELLVFFWNHLFSIEIKADLAKEGVFIASEALIKIDENLQS